MTRWGWLTADTCTPSAPPGCFARPAPLRTFPEGHRDGVRPLCGVRAPARGAHEPARRRFHTGTVCGTNGGGRCQGVQVWLMADGP
jgi:hypothetical protein